MNENFRALTYKDLELYKKVQTNLERDYVKDIFPLLTVGDNRLFGLFVDNTLVAVAGYTMYAKHYAMLGRLRSDARYRGNSYGTKILNYAKEQALKNPVVYWVGANTEENNLPAQKVLKKIELPHLITLYGAKTDDLSPFTNGDSPWQEITSLEEKKQWLETTYLDKSFGKDIFPYKSYYPFPISDSLFTDDNLRKWAFYENSSQSRYVILWEEETDTHYVHVTYPWSDFTTQPGLWETIDRHLTQLKTEKGEGYVWIDLTKDDVASLPENHPFELNSPWMLHGKWLSDEEKAVQKDSLSMEEVTEQLDEIEKEITELTDELEDREEILNQLNKRLEEIDS